jgi:RES domain-containing protein
MALNIEDIGKSLTPKQRREIDARLRRSTLATVRAANNWFQFEDHVRFVNRSAPKMPQYLARMMRGCMERVVRIDSGQSLFRARILPPPTGDAPKMFSRKEMGAPPPGLCRPGRLNPVGIPYLYLASNAETALAEVRPWVGAEVAVSEFRTRRRLRIALLDWRTKDFPRASEELSWLFSALSVPVHQENPVAYAPTQYFAERLKAAGVDGLIYRSALAPSGTNVALFDPKAAAAGKPTVYKVDAVTVTASPDGPTNP